MADAKHAKPAESRRRRRRGRKAAPDVDGTDAATGEGVAAEGAATEAGAATGATAVSAVSAMSDTGHGDEARAAESNEPGDLPPPSERSRLDQPTPAVAAGDAHETGTGEDIDRQDDGPRWDGSQWDESEWNGSGTEEPHGEDHGGDAHGHGTKAVVAALLANFAVAVAKFVGFLITGSSSMLAESVHSVADSGNQGLLLLGGRRARRAADQEHPFGYGRERYFWGFVVALVLFTLGSLFAIYEAIHKIEHPEPIEGPQWALAILAFAFVAEGLSFRTAVREASRVKGKSSYWQFIRRAKSPELPVVLLEDFAALMGLIFAIAGVTAATVTDDGSWDGYGTLAIGILLGIVAVILVIEMKSLLIGESASRKDVESIRSAVEVEPTVVGVIHLRAEHIGPEELLVGTKVEFQHDLTMVEVSAAIDRVERSIRAGVPSARVIYVEPDVHQEHKDHQDFSGYVAEHAGHIDPHDPKYAAITGQHRAITVHQDTADDDDIWS